MMRSSNTNPKRKFGSCAIRPLFAENARKTTVIPERQPGGRDHFPHSKEHP